MTKRRFGKRLALCAIIAAMIGRAAARAQQAETRAEAGQADQCRRRAVGRTQCHALAAARRASASPPISSPASRAGCRRPNGLCGLETGPETFQIVTSNDAQAAQLKGFIGKEVSLKVDEVACAQEAGQMSEAVVTKWSVVTKHCDQRPILPSASTGKPSPSSSSKCPRRCSHASRIRLGTATSDADREEQRPSGRLRHDSPRPTTNRCARPRQAR